MEKQTPTTQEEARQYAIKWQKWASEQSLSYSELIQWHNLFVDLAGIFDLTAEFKDNGII